MKDIGGVEIPADCSASGLPELAPQSGLSPDADRRRKWVRTFDRAQQEALRHAVEEPGPDFKVVTPGVDFGQVDFGAEGEFLLIVKNEGVAPGQVYGVRPELPAGGAVG